MKIALLAHLHHPVAEPFAGGMETHTSLVAGHLIRRGHDVTLFARAGSVTEARLHPVLAASFDYSRTRNEDEFDACDSVLDTATTRALIAIATGHYMMAAQLPQQQDGDRVHRDIPCARLMAESSTSTNARGPGVALPVSQSVLAQALF